MKAIFELVNTTDGNNTASTLLGSIFNDPMTEENVGKFIRNKQLTYTTYQKLTDPMGNSVVEAMIVKYLIECRLLPLQHIPICCELEELLRTPGTAQPDSFDTMIQMIQQVQIIHQAGTSAYAIRQKQQPSFVATAATTIDAATPPKTSITPPAKKIDYSQACNQSRDKVMDSPKLLNSPTIECGRPNCKYNHDSTAIKTAIDKYVVRAAKILEAKAAPAVTNQDTKGYSQSSYAYSNITITMHRSNSSRFHPAHWPGNNGRISTRCSTPHPMVST